MFLDVFYFLVEVPFEVHPLFNHIYMVKYILLPSAKGCKQPMAYLYIIKICLGGWVKFIVSFLLFGLGLLSGLSTPSTMASTLYSATEIERATVLPHKVVEPNSNRKKCLSG